MSTTTKPWTVRLSTTSTNVAESPFPLYLSPSQIKGLLTCGEQFRLTRMEKVPERPMWASIGGSTVHKVTEILDRQLWEASHA
jgi:hypothetical protein